MIELITKINSRFLKIDGDVYHDFDCGIEGVGDSILVVVKSDEVYRTLIRHSFSQLPSEIEVIRFSNAAQVFNKPIYQSVGIFIRKYETVVSYGLVYAPFEWAQGYSADDHQKTFGTLLDDEGIRWNGNNESLEVFFTVSDMEARISDTLHEIDATLARLDKRTENLLIATFGEKSVIASFDFPEPVKTSCEQYLLYFVQFLKELGVEANATLRHQAGQVLFAVTPQDDKDALDKIRSALEEYLRLPSSPISDTTHESIAVQKLEANILRLRSDLKLSAAELQAKNTTIQAQQLIIDVQKGLLSGEILINSIKDVTPKAEDKEDLIKGLVALSTYKDKGVEVHLGEVLRRLKKKFAKMDE